MFAKSVLLVATIASASAFAPSMQLVSRERSLG